MASNRIKVNKRGSAAVGKPGNSRENIVLGTLSGSDIWNLRLRKSIPLSGFDLGQGRRATAPIGIAARSASIAASSETA
jgi:hypothetical protein